MIIATNVTTENLGGITRGNVNFMNSLQGKCKGVIGLEMTTQPHIQSSAIFNHLSPDWFKHHVINTHNLSIEKALGSASTVDDLENIYRPIIETVKEILTEEHPDVMFLNGTYYIPWILSIAAHELNIPIVLRYAGVYSKETEGSSPKDRTILNEIEKSFQERVSHFIFPSQICKEVVEKEVAGKNIDNAFVIPNAVNIPQGTPEFKSVERSIAAIGRWDRIKNFSAFFDLHQTLKNQKWEHTATFVTGDANIRNMPETITRLPSMNHEELLKFYSTQGLIISPSLFETFGNVPMEAACMGIPVLVSDTMGCAEVLKKVGLEKMVMSFKDTEQVAQRIQDLCGQGIMPEQIQALRTMLDPELINTQVASILHEAAMSRK